MVVMEARLGVIGKPMGRLYALFALLMSFSMGAMAQSGALADTFFAAFSLPRAETGLATAALALVILLGGIRRIADVSSVLVPVMALLYIGGAGAVIIGNLPRLPGAAAECSAVRWPPRRRWAAHWGRLRGVLSSATA